MVNVVVWIVIGGVTGWLGSLVLRSAAERGTMFNMLVSVAGALSAEMVLTPLLGISRQRSDFGLPALVGAIAFLAVFSGFRRLAQEYRPGE